MTLESSKYLGGVGALLLVISGIGLFGSAFVGILGLVGLILILIALKGLADFYKESGIFNNALYAVIAAIVGIVATVGTLFAALIAFMTNLPDWARPYVEAGDWQGFSTALQNHVMDFNSFLQLFGSLFTLLILALVMLFIFAVVAMFFFRRSLGLLSAKTHVGLFGTAGLLMLIGAVLTIVVFGLVLIWIGLILLMIAFFSISETAPAPATAQTPSQTPTTLPQ